MKLRTGTRLSPNLEKCCLLLVSNESFANAEQDIEVLTGMKIPHSTQHRLINNYQLPEPKINTRVKSLSVDGGTVRLRTELGQKSEWKNYKAIKIHEQAGMAFFHNNQSLLNWVNQQPLSQNVSCLGDGHDGVWNIVQNYLRKHRFRIPDYQLYQDLGICIASGSVESWIKQIGSRVKIVGAQWNQQNVSQILWLRCAYLNKEISLSICT